MCVCVCVCITKDSLRKKHYRPTQKILKESYNLLRKSTLNGHKVRASSTITSKSCHSTLCRHLCKNKNRI